MLNFSFSRLSSTIKSSNLPSKFIGVLLVVVCINHAASFSEPEKVSYPLISKDIGSSNIHLLAKRELVEKVFEEVEEVELETECVDKSNRCARWAKRDYCAHKDHKRFMTVNCKSSCNLCPGNDNGANEITCKNDRKECQYWTKAGYCNKKTYRKFMNVNCKLSCGLCSQNVTTTSITVTVSMTSFSNATLTTGIALTEKTTTDNTNSFINLENTTTVEEDIEQTTTSTLPTLAEDLTTQAITIPATTFKNDFNQSTTPSSTDKNISTPSMVQITFQETTTPVNNVTTPLTTTGANPTPCTNRLSSCRFLGRERCLTTSFMKLFCKAHCNLCNTADSQTTTSKSTAFPILTSPQNEESTNVATTIETTSTVPAKSETTVEDCFDDFAECSEVSGFCGKNVNVTNKCRLTCGQCVGNYSGSIISTTPFPLTTVLATTVEQCEDTFPKCEELVSECNNSAYNSFLHVTCKQTCGLCPKLEVTTPSLNTYTQTTSNVIECEDKSEVCSGWFDYGFCTTIIYPDMKNFMQNNCKKSCDLCGNNTWSEWSTCSLSCGGGEKIRQRKCIEDDCESETIVETATCNLDVCPISRNNCSDRLALKSCEQYKERNGCNTTVISQLCQLTCGKCSNEDNLSDDGKSNPKVCRDINPRCANWTERGLCSNNDTTFMQRHCPDSCGLCSVWQTWSEWSLCTLPCGSGLQTRNRTCDSKSCNGSNTDSRPCNTFSCPTCFDSSPSCPLFEKMGKCRDIAWKLMCRKTCGICRAEPIQVIEGPCADTREGCRQAGINGRCSDQKIAALCPNTCKMCTGSSESISAIACEDGHSNCRFAESSGRCTDANVAQLCKKSCKLCTSTTPATPILSNPSLNKQVPGECVDQLSVCTAVAANCDQSTVQKYCPKTCKLCVDTASVQVEGCVDGDSTCPQLARMGQCANKLVADTCKLSCNNCKQDGARQLIIGTTAVTTTSCIDQIVSCSELVQFLNCTNPMVLRSCQKTCGKCQGPNIPKPTSTNSPTVATPAEKCTDSHDSCPKYAAEGLCQRNFYKFLCPVSCRDCNNNIEQTVDVCQDNLPNCQLFASKCDVSYVQQLCKVTCNKCPSQTCEDIDEPVCNTLSELGLCEKSRFRKQCPKTCNVCTTSSENDQACTDTRDDCPSLFSKGYCQFGFISKGCQKTCSVCEESTTSLDENETKEGPGLPCMDANDQCPTFFEMGQCRSTASVEFFCAKSCDMCPTEDAKKRTLVKNCIDENVATCKKYSTLCSFSSIADKCPVTCKKCEPVDQEGKSDTASEPELLGTDDCRDHLSKCNEFKGYCGVTKWINYMDTMCPYTCNACEKVAQTAWSQWGSWSPWSECSKSCNDIPGPLSPESGGDTIRTRVCPEGYRCNGENRQTAKCRKDYCPGINGNETTVRCVDEEYCEQWAIEGRCRTVRFRDQAQLNCPIACKHCIPKLIWGNWSECDAVCGEGNQTRTKECEAEGKCDDESGRNETETRSCMMEPCDSWTKWSPWTRCSSTCGSGTSLRIRICSKGEPGDGMCKGNYVEERICENNVSCPVWDSWSAWSSCTEKCDGGYKNRTRKCFHSSENVTCVGPPEEMDVCNEHSCTTWLQWNEWEVCSIPCGGNGTQSRTRICPGLKGQCGDDSESRQESVCGTTKCSIWSRWGQWSLCSATCGGGGLQERSRTCGENEVCIGDATDTRTCSSSNPCIRWSEWSKFDECSVSCGGGIATRFRTCPPGVDVLTECPGNSTETTICNCKICPTTGIWSAWGDFGPCSVSCAGGKMLRRRICLNGIPGRGGCQGVSHDLLSCADEECPIGMWEEWSSWSACSTSCGTGIMFRDRNCVDGVVGVSGCAGSNETVEQCNTHECPSWSLWQPWSSCTLTCGEGGTRTRIKQCFDPSINEVVTDESCGAMSDIFEKESCNVKSCPAWTEWLSWGPCSSECGVGWTYRNRSCVNGKIGEIGCDEGKKAERIICNTWDCAPACNMMSLGLSSPNLAPANLFNASSEFLMYGASEARLDSKLAWCPEVEDHEKWLEIDFEMPLEVTGILIQGYIRNGKTSLPKYTWIPRFSVSYANYSNELEPVRDNADRTRLFRGPEGPIATVSRTWFPITASRVRIQVLTSNPSQIGCLRMELLTCVGSHTIADLELLGSGSAIDDF